MEEFKQGDTVEVSDNGVDWYEKIFAVKHNCLFYCEHSSYLLSWKFCRKPKQTVEEWTREWYEKNKHLDRLTHYLTYMNKYYNDRKAWGAENQ